MPNPVDQGQTVELMLEGLVLSEESLRCSINWAGQDYPCTSGPEYGARTIDEGGFKVRSHVKVKVRTSVFDRSIGFPQEKQTITYTPSVNSTPRTYRIDSITNYYDAVLELVCVDPRLGA
jgi:hypothetical protein